MAKRALGRGLSALIGDSVAPRTATQMERQKPPMLGDREAVMLPIRELSPNPHQPRHGMDDQALQELAASIKQHGVLQPILARQLGKRYELVAGERRLRAASMAGLELIPALVCTMEETESMKVALLENIQRENLNALEEAEAYRSIMEAIGATHQELADMLGKNRSTVTNIMRLLQLDESIRPLVENGSLSMGHARALLAVEDVEARQRLARHAATKGLSVRALEHEVRRLVTLSSSAADRRKRRGKISDPDAPALREFETRLRHHLGSPVKIARRGEKGRIEIQFFSNAELEGVLERMGISPQL